MSKKKARNEKTHYQQAVENLLNKKVKRTAKSIKTILFSEEGKKLKDFIVQFFLQVRKSNPTRSTNLERSLRDRRLDAISKIIMGDETCAAFAILDDSILVATNTNQHDRLVIGHEIEFDIDPGNLKKNAESSPGLSIDVWVSLFANLKSEGSYDSSTKKGSKQGGMRCVRVSQKQGPFTFPYKEGIVWKKGPSKQWGYFINPLGKFLSFKMDANQYKEKLALELERKREFEIATTLKDEWIGPMKMYWRSRRKKVLNRFHMPTYRFVEERVFDRNGMRLPLYRIEIDQLHQRITKLFDYLFVIREIFRRPASNFPDLDNLWRSQLTDLLKHSLGEELRSQLNIDKFDKKDVELLEKFIKDLVSNFHALRKKQLKFIRSQRIKIFLSLDAFGKSVDALSNNLTVKNKKDFISIFLSLLERYLIDIEKLSSWAHTLSEDDPVVNLIRAVSQVFEKDPKPFPMRVVDDLDKHGHAEMRILNYLLAEKIDPNGLIYLSIAKLCCAHCYYTLQKYGVNKIPGKHGNLFGRWRLPDIIKNDEEQLQLFFGETLYEQYQGLGGDDRQLVIIMVESLADLNNKDTLKKLGLADTSPIWCTITREDQFPDESEDESSVEKPKEYPLKDFDLQESENIKNGAEFPKVSIKQRYDPAIAPGILLASDGLNDLTLEITVNFFNPSREKSVEKDLNVKGLDYQL